jgi:hypothetical protein
MRGSTPILAENATLPSCKKEYAYRLLSYILLSIIKRAPLNIRFFFANLGEKARMPGTLRIA